MRFFNRIGAVSSTAVAALAAATVLATAFDSSPAAAQSKPSIDPSKTMRALRSEVSDAESQVTATKKTAQLQMPQRGGVIVIKVENFDAARLRILEAAKEQGGDMLDSRTVVGEKGRKSGWARLRLPYDKMDTLLAFVRSEGKVYAERINTKDRASAHDTLMRRAQRLREHESRLNGLLQDGRKLRGSDLLYIQERLFRAAVDESLLEQERTDMEHDVRVGVVTVQMFEPLVWVRNGDNHAHLKQRLAHAWSGALTALVAQVEHLITTIFYWIVMAPLYLPLVFIALLGFRFWKRRAGFSERLDGFTERLLVGLQSALSRNTKPSGTGSAAKPCEMGKNETDNTPI